MAVAVASSTSAVTSFGGSSGGSLNVSPPSGLSAGDLWIICGNLDLDPGATISLPSGWTAIGSQVNGQEGWPGLRVFGKIAGASETAVSVSCTGTVYDFFCESIRITGQHATTWLGNVATATSTGTGNTLDAPDVTIQDNGNLALLFFASEGDSPSTQTIAPPSGTTTIVEREGAVFPNASSAYEARNAGAYAPGNWTVTRSESDILDGVALTVEIRVAAAGGGGTTTSKTMTDTVAVTDATVSGARRPRISGDSLSLTEPGLQRTFLITRDDSVEATDGTISWRRLRRVAQDNIDVIDGFSKSVVGSNLVYAKVMSDSLTVVDDAGRRWTRRLSVTTDTVDLTDQITRTLRSVRIVGDGIDLTDSFAKVLLGAGFTYTKIMSDTMAVADSVLNGTLRPRVTTDAVALVDQLIRYAQRIRSLGENVEVFDETVKIRRTMKFMDDGIDITDDRISTLYLDQMSSVSFRYGSSAPPFRFGGV